MDRENKGSPGRENCVSKDTEARRRIQGNFLDEQKELLFIVHGREKILRQFYEGRIILNLNMHYTVYWDSVEKCAAYAHAEEGIRKLVERCQLPFLPTPMGKGVIPDNHPNCVGAARSRLISVQKNWGIM